jgi:signal transduction histidine kinase
MRNTARGIYNSKHATSRHQEIRLLHQEAQQMANRIRQRTEDLEKEIANRQQIAAELMQHRHNLAALVKVRTAELDQANQSLRQEMSQRKIAQKTIIQVSTHEQQRIGQDLHDTLGQEIVGARYLLSSIERSLESTAPHCKERLQQLNTMLHDIMEHARMLAHGLMVVDLNEGGLAVALESYARKTADLFGIRCRFRLQSEVLAEFDEATSVQLYHIAQEAVSNAIRHGRASRIRIALGFRGGIPCLRITDNGSGFSNPGTGGTGLLIMRSRAESIAGQLQVWSRPHLGSCIRCCLPQKEKP